MSKKVLLLSASAGAGHMRAADALLKVFEKHPDVSHVEHWDMLKYTNRLFRHLYSQTYLDLVNKVPAVLGWFYDLSDTPYRNDKIRTIFEKLNSLPFIKAIKKYEPDLVVCTHFTPAAILSWLADKNKLSILPAITVTDFDCHAMWLVHNYLKYFVALPETAVYLSRMGIDSSKIEVTGIPVDPVFEEEKNRTSVRKSLGLSEDKFTILVSAGGFGVGPVENLIRELLRIKYPVQIVAIAGRSEELKRKLEALAKNPKDAKATLHAIGFTTQMDDYMAASDILVGKAGGLTTSEALARGLPLCIVNPIPGQEERNSDHLLEAGAAVRCNNLPTLSWKLEQIISDQSRMTALRENAKDLGCPLAARNIVDSLMRDCPTGKPPDSPIYAISKPKKRGKVSHASKLRPSSWASNIDSKNVRNFFLVDRGLYRSARLDHGAMRELEKMGIKTVLNLRHFHEDRDKALGTKLKLAEVPINTWHIREKDIVAALRIIMDKDNHPILVHCQHGADRTGVIIALYRMLVQGWSKEEALEELTSGGFGFHSIWAHIPKFIRALNVQSLREKVKLTNDNSS